MNDSTQISTQWLQYYQQPTAATTLEAAASDNRHSNTTTSTIVTSSLTNNNNTSSPNNSPSINVSTSTTHLHPQGTVAKPIRRRSRACRRTPTTLLNASATNFRSLVQQFTGCHNTKTLSSYQKGPINLSFGTPTNQNNIIEHSNSSRIAPYGGGYHNHPTAVAQPSQLQQQPNMQSTSTTLDDDFVINDASSRELIDESSFHGIKKDGVNYFF